MLLFSYMYNAGIFYRRSRATGQCRQLKQIADTANIIKYLIEYYCSAIFIRRRYFTEGPGRPESPVDSAESKLLINLQAGLGIFYRKIPTLISFATLNPLLSIGNFVLCEERPRALPFGNLRFFEKNRVKL